MTDRHLAIAAIVIAVVGFLWTVGWSIWIERRIPRVHVTTESGVLITFQDGSADATFPVRISNVGAQPVLVTEVRLLVDGHDSPPQEWCAAKLPFQLAPASHVDMPVANLAALKKQFERRFGGSREWWKVQIRIRDAARREFDFEQQLPGLMPLE